MRKIGLLLLILLVIYGCGGGGSSGNAQAITTDTITEEVVKARGIKTALDDRLDVILNEDGTIKSSLKDTFLRGMIFTQRTISDIDGVASVSCNSDEGVMGGGVFCDGKPSDGEGGVLFATYPFISTTTGWIGGCYDLYPPQSKVLITVYALCATQVPGQVVAGKPFVTLEDEERRLHEMRQAHQIHLK